MMNAFAFSFSPPCWLSIILDAFDKNINKNYSHLLFSKIRILFLDWGFFFKCVPFFSIECLSAVSRQLLRCSYNAIRRPRPTACRRDIVQEDAPHRPAILWEFLYKNLCVNAFQPGEDSMDLLMTRSYYLRLSIRTNHTPTISEANNQNKKPQQENKPKGHHRFVNALDAGAPRVCII